jgi:hypothetical protein
MSRKKIDKIFNNNFDEQDYNPFPINFVDAGDSDNQEDNIEEKLLYESMHELLLDSDFAHFVIENNDDKPNKLQSNKIFSYLSENLKDFSKIDIWSSMADYFRMNPTKLYSYLSNTYKSELIEELNNNEKYLKTVKSKKLF